MKKIQDGDLHVYTFKEGLLSRVAHNLRLRATRFEVQVEGERVRASVWPESLKVEGTMEGEQLRTDQLRPKDTEEILKTIREKILKVRAYPTVSFEGTLSGAVLSGELTLLGQKRAARGQVQHSAAGSQGTFQLTPSLWGIAPYKALMGAIKLQDRVEVRFELPRLLEEAP